MLSQHRYIWHKPILSGPMGHTEGSDHDKFGEHLLGSYSSVSTIFSFSSSFIIFSTLAYLCGFLAVTAINYVIGASQIN